MIYQVMTLIRYRIAGFPANRTELVTLWCLSFSYRKCRTAIGLAVRRSLGDPAKYSTANIKNLGVSRDEGSNAAPTYVKA